MYKFSNLQVLENSSPVTRACSPSSTPVSCSVFFSRQSCYSLSTSGVSPSVISASSSVARPPFTKIICRRHPPKTKTQCVIGSHFMILRFHNPIYIFFLVYLMQFIQVLRGPRCRPRSRRRCLVVCRRSRRLGVAPLSQRRRTLFFLASPPLANDFLAADFPAADFLSRRKPATAEP